MQVIEKKDLKVHCYINPDVYYPSFMVMLCENDHGEIIIQHPNGDRVKFTGIS